MLKEGKLPWSILSKLLDELPTSDPDVVVGPSIGEDAGVVRLGDGFLVVHSDPITTAVKRIGWYAVHIAANDIAVRGVRPRWFLPVILLSPKMDNRMVEELFHDMSSALKSIGGVVIGGHTEVTPGIDRPIVSMTVIGYSRKRVILTRDARVGDKILLIGRAGGEGVAVIASDYSYKLLDLGVKRSIIEKASEFLYDISVVDKALMLAETGLVNSMHDPTEGGIIQALREIGAASGSCARIYRDQVPLDPVVEAISGALGIDPLKLLSSGSLVATIPPDKDSIVVKLLDEKGFTHSIIGEVVDCEEPGSVMVVSGNRVDVVKEDVIDEIYRVIARLSKR